MVTRQARVIQRGRGLAHGWSETTDAADAWLVARGVADGAQLITAGEEH